MFYAYFLNSKEIFMRSSDQSTRDLVRTINGAGWDYSKTRHPYFEIERPKGAQKWFYNEDPLNALRNIYV